MTYQNYKSRSYHNSSWGDENKPELLTDLVNHSPQFESPEGWGPGFAKATGHGPGVVVGPGTENPNVIAQQFSAQPYERFRIVAKASTPQTICDVLGISKSKALGRLQINWLDAQSKFISAHVETIEVTSEEQTYETYVIAPSGTATGTLLV